LTLGIQTEAIQPTLGQPQRIPTEPSPQTASPRPPKPALARLRRDESAQDMVEYGLLAAVLGLGALSGINNLAGKVSDVFGNLTNGVNKATQNDPSQGHGDHGSGGGRGGGSDRGGGGFGGGWGWH
jgi:Flp pilus assembly pilin Flp